MIEIPEYTPAGNKVDIIGIWASGGADSSVLCYLLAEKIKKENLQVKIKTFTVQKSHGSFEFLKVIDRIKELLDCHDVFLENIVYEAPLDGWVHEDYQEVYHIKNKENIKNNLFQVLYSGITTNPPKQVQETFKWGVLEDVELIRGVEVSKDTTRWFLKEEDNNTYEFFELKPFFNFDKQSVAKIYKEKGLEETLFPLTRSCEKKGTTVGHCGECWWCEERKWGFGKL